MFLNELTGEDYVECIQPLVSPLRHPPCKCVDIPGDELIPYIPLALFRGYGILPPKRTLLDGLLECINAGASSWLDGGGGPSISSFVELWQRHGIAFFDHVMTVFPAVCCGLWVRLSLAGRPVINALVFASLWVLLELLRGKLMGGFPWILIGYSQTSGPVGHLAPFIGVYGLSLLIVLMSALVIVILFGTKKSRLSAFLMAVILLLTSFVLKGLEFSTPSGDPLGVRLVQGNVPQAMKFSRERLNSALQLYTSMTVEEPLDDINLVIWPETAVPTHYNRVEQWMEPFAASMDARGVDVPTGVFVKEGDDVYNAVKQLGGQREVYRVCSAEAMLEHCRVGV